RTNGPTRAKNEPFLFSSRRRHTRWPRDWSSDVCSSDLLHYIRQIIADAAKSAVLTGRHSQWESTLPVPDGRGLPSPEQSFTDTRSEERRVGKEFRFRLSAYL